MHSKMGKGYKMHILEIQIETVFFLQLNLYLILSSNIYVISEFELNMFRKSWLHSRLTLFFFSLHLNQKN